MAIKEVEINEHPRTQVAKLGLIGMGNMGSHMACRLLAAGYQLTVYDRTKEKAQALEQSGALAAATPRKLAAGSDVVLVMVFDDEAQEQVMFGLDGMDEDFSVMIKFMQELAGVPGQRQSEP